MLKELSLMLVLGIAISGLGCSGGGGDKDGHVVAPPMTADEEAEMKRDLDEQAQMANPDFISTRTE